MFWVGFRGFSSELPQKKVVQVHPYHIAQHASLPYRNQATCCATIAVSDTAIIASDPGPSTFPHSYIPRICVLARARFLRCFRQPQCSRQQPGPTFLNVTSVASGGALYPVPISSLLAAPFFCHFPCVLSSVLPFALPFALYVALRCIFPFALPFVLPRALFLLPRPWSCLMLSLFVVLPFVLLSELISTRDCRQRSARLPATNLCVGSLTYPPPCRF